MPLYKDEAIILRHYDLGDADRIISFFARRYGRMRAVAKGSRKLKSRFAGRLEPFHVISITFFGRENAELFKLSGAEIIRAHPSLSDNLEKFYRACYLNEAVETGLREGDPNGAAFHAVAQTLQRLADSSSPMEREWITRFFDVKFLSALGYRPSMGHCAVCRKEWPGNGNPVFDPARGGLVCRACGGKQNNVISLSSGAVKFLNRITSTGFDKAARLKPSPQLMDEISRTVIAFRNARLQTVFRTEQLLHSSLKE